MTKRNFILIVMILVLLTLGFFAYLSFQKPTPPGTPDEGINFFDDFNPFGQSPNNNNQNGEEEEPGDISGYVPPEGDTSAEFQLRKISSVPVGGYGLFLKERYKAVTPIDLDEATPPPNPDKPTPPATEFAPAIRYVDRATGNIYQTFLDQFDERKFSNTLIPKVYEAFFGSKAESVLMRYLKTDDRTIVTFLGTLPKEVLGGDSEEANEVKGTFLPEGVTDLSVSSDGSKIFYLVNSGEIALGTIWEIATGKRTQIFDSPFTEWLSSWNSANLITLTTKPASSVPGYMYTLDPVKKIFAMSLGPVAGLTTLASPDGKQALYSSNLLDLSLFNITTKETISTGLRTLPEKCAWTGDSKTIYCAVPNSYPTLPIPESWYQGQVTFSDEIWKIDVASGNTTQMIDLSTSGGSIDAIKLKVEETANSLLLINKKDSFLWEMKLD